jgi:hypothetical protein
VVPVREKSSLQSILQEINQKYEIRERERERERERKRERERERKKERKRKREREREEIHVDSFALKTIKSIKSLVDKESDCSESKHFDVRCCIHIRKTIQIRTLPINNEIT